VQFCTCLPTEMVYQPTQSPDHANLNSLYAKNAVGEKKAVSEFQAIGSRPTTAWSNSSDNKRYPCLITPALP